MSISIPIRTLVAAIAGVLLPLGVQGQTIWYVDDDAPNDPGPGDPTVSDPLEDGSPDHPFDAIQEGINAAVDGDTVLAADGTYAGDGNKNLDFGGKAITVRSENGPNDCVIDCEGDGRGFYFHSGEAAASVVDGFTITNGYESLGGGIYCANASPTVVNCKIVENRSQERGGGIYCGGYSNPTIPNTLISGNTAEFGGGVYCEAGNPLIIGCTICRNTAVGYDCPQGQMPCYVIGRGGGVCCEGEWECNITIVDCDIFQNTAGVDGGGIYFVGDSLAISNSNVEDNTAVSGGGLLVWADTADIMNCRITRNTAAYGSGGGMAVSLSDYPPTGSVIGCVIAYNTAYDSGGGISYEGGLYVLANCTIVSNWAGQCGGGICGSYGCPRIVGSIIWNNAPEGIYAQYGWTEVWYSDVQGRAYDYEDCGNICADPLLTRDGIHLQAGSPCRDAGDPNAAGGELTDIDGEPRVINERADMGADEWLDTDDDGLPDFWEQRYFGSPTAGDPSADDDGDGLTGLDEYGLSRNPLRGPAMFYVDLAGDDGWDGLAPAWDGQHGPKATIQAAIESTAYYEGDEVVVADGVYSGTGNKNLDPLGRQIVVRSANGPADCILDCEHSGRGFFFHTCEDETTVVSGFTIWDGRANYRTPGGPFGGGICCNLSDPTIANVRILGCRSSAFAFGFGGGLLCEYSSPALSNCLIVGNTVSGSFGGAGGGIGCYSYSNPVIRNTTISGNSASAGGGLDAWGFSNPNVSNCIFWGSSAGTGPEIALRGGSESPASLTISYSDVAGGMASAYVQQNCTLDWREGNIDADPLFVDPDNDPNTWEDHDYRLLSGSPCINAGSNYATNHTSTDIEGDQRIQHCRVNMGAYESPHPPTVFDDCNENGEDDNCDVYEGASQDCNRNHTPDECDIADGSSADCQPDGVLDECQARYEYAWDDGGHELNVGVVFGGYIGWLNHFVVEAGAETIGAVKIVYGYVPEDTPVTVYLWSDPDGDGNPDDARVLASVSTVAQNSNTNIFTETEVSPVYVGPVGTSFFVGATMYVLGGPDPPGVYPCALDRTTSADQSWFVLDPVEPIDPNNLDYPQYTGRWFGPIDQYSSPGNWLIRAVGAGVDADCNWNGVPDECDIAEGMSDDCNENAMPDECDIAQGTSEDVNQNGIPDECDCPGDLDGDWNVDLSDLGQLLSHYGMTNGATYADGDLDFDSDVDLTDLAALLAVYGTTCE